MTGVDDAKRAIRACQHAGLPIVNPEDCTCALRGRLVVVAGPDGLELCGRTSSAARSTDSRLRTIPAGHSRSRRPSGGSRHANRAMERSVPESARRLAAQLDALFSQDAALAERLNAVQWRLRRANDRLWWGLHPDGLAAVYPAAR